MANGKKNIIELLLSKDGVMQEFCSKKMPWETV